MITATFAVIVILNQIKDGRFMYDNYILDREYFIKVIEDMINTFEEQRDYLTSLDSQIGDGDHGINLSIGFRHVNKILPDLKDKDLTTLWKKVGMALLSKVGGSSGPLYGKFFMDFGAKAEKKDSVNFKEFCDMFNAGVAAVEKIGKASVGEKTMVDALRPAVDTLNKALEEEKEPREAFDQFVNTAHAGAESTIPLVAKKGRAMRLGERAIGHKDPGAASSVMILKIFKEHLYDKEGNRS